MRKWLLALALVASPYVFSDPVGGRLDHVDIINAEDTDTYHVDLRADETTIIKLGGNGNTDLDLYLYDENWNLIAKSDSYNDVEDVSVDPKWTGLFYIRIINRGVYPNRYLLTAY